MPKSRIIILAVATIIAGVVAFLSNTSSPRQETSQVQEVSPEIEEIVPVRVLVAARDLPLGDYLERKDMIWMEVLPDQVPVNAVTEKLRPGAIRDFNGWAINSPLSKGDPVFQNRLIDSEGAGFIATQLAPGMRAGSVQIDPARAAGGFITPNDRVDVVLVQKPKNSRNAMNIVSRTILENMRVIAINQVYVQDKKTSKSGTPIHHIRGETATLEMTPRDADILAVASDLGKIHLILRGLQDRGAPQGATGYGLNLLPEMSRVPIYTREGKSEVLRAGEYR